MRRSCLIVTLPRLLPSTVMDVKHLNRVVCDAIEEPVRVADERDHANARTLRNLLRALWPALDTLLDGAKPFLKRHGYRRIMQFYEFKDFVEVAQSFVGIDDLHERRCFVNTALSSASVAKRPSRATLRPRSMPSSSSGVA